MNIHTLIAGPFSTNAFLVACPESKEAVIIDPAPGTVEQFKAIIDQEGYTLRKILLTHSHWDHIADVFPLKTFFAAQVFVHKKDEKNLIQPGTDGLPFWVHIRGVAPDSYLHDGDIIEVGSIQLQVIETPGHSPGGVCFFEPNKKVLFSGDTIFKGAIGNLSFPTAQPELMQDSLNRIADLPPETLVYTGHGETTTIGTESRLKKANELYNF